jgi:hypothetical protein
VLLYESLHSAVSIQTSESLDVLDKIPKSLKMLIALPSAQNL